jgi:crotonobetainyl-CoA:carnitine CoA-transferase CaiB-like acyl-CoA transferase
MSWALAGVRVLDLADRSGSLTGRILADLGAEVILVEPPTGNPTRGLAPFLDDQPGPDRSFAHLYYNANKRSVVLDLDDPADRDRFLALTATAQAVIDTERPGRLAELGLGHQRLREVSPGLVQVSITPYGQHGQWRDRTATDLTAGASGGLLWVSGEPRGVPVQGGADPSYALAGLTGASAAMIALTARWRRHGSADEPWPGVHVDISLQEATVMSVVQTSAAGQLVWHDKLPRRPGLSNAIVCADGGYVGLLVRPDRFDEFLAWCDRVGIDHGMTSADWEWSLLSAPRQGNPVAAATLALAKALTRDEFAAGALEADLVCLPVLGFDDLVDHEQFVVNDQFLTVGHDALGAELGFVRSPVDAMADGVVIAPAPQLGQHQALLDDLPELGSGSSHSPGSSPAVQAEPADPARALDGIRVVDFGWVLAAPIGTRLLASFGAEVIRVESEKKPDSMRSQIGPHGVPDPDLGGLFNTVNAGKKSLSIDLSTERGLALIKDLIATADVVVNNFRPGAMDRMGLGYDVLTTIKPDIVLLNLPGAHRKGPWAVRSSMGNILMAASGFNMLTGFDGERPRGIGIPYPDFTSPHLLVSTVLAALRQRDRTGAGQQLHLAQLSGTVSLLGAEWMQYAATGRQPPRRANRDANYCPHGVYPAQGSAESDDEWVTIAVSPSADDAQWRSLCRLMGRPELIDDPRFADHRARKANEDALDAEVGAWTAELDKWACAERCQQAGIAAAPVEHLADTYRRDPQLRHHYQIVHQPTDPSVDIPIDREAAQWVGADHRLVRSPMMGEHNQYVVQEILGRSEEDYISLVVDDVLG